MLAVEHLSGGYGDKKIVNDVSFKVCKGEFFGILGPNGSGKTTLLKMLTGVQPFTNGTVLIKEKNLNTYSAKALAKIMAVLPQSVEQSFTYSVQEVVALGRYPYQRGLLKTLTANDKQVIHRAMKQVNVAQFADHSIHTLSGGEKQRVYLAQALAQEPELLFLDEPTNHLDVSHQKSLLDTLRKWADEKGMTIISIFHDLNLASLYCDRLLLMENGKIKSLAQPPAVLREETVEHVYQIKTKRMIHPERPRPLMTILPQKTTSEKKEVSFSEIHLEESDEMIKIEFPYEMKTLSSAVIGSGFAWKKTFVNRHVSKNYICDDPVSDLVRFIKKHQLVPDDTVAMMTAAYLSNHGKRYVVNEDVELLAIVTAGVGNAVDASKAKRHEWQKQPIGTINGWIFINGHLSEEAFIQAIMTATEAKAKALFDEKVIDPVTNSIATGTSTDSLLIAATQRGTRHQYAGTITSIGKEIGEAVYQCTIEAIRNGRMVK